MDHVKLQESSRRLAVLAAAKVADNLGLIVSRIGTSAEEAGNISRACCPFTL